MASPAINMMYTPLTRPVRGLSFPQFSPSQSTESTRILLLVRWSPVMCSAIRETSAASGKTEADPAAVEAAAAATAAAPKSKIPAKPKKSPVKALPELMEEEVIPALKATLKAEEDVTQIELSSSDNKVHLAASAHTNRIEELKQRVRKELSNGSSLNSIMTSIDTIQSLGMSYQFEEEIATLLERFCHVEGGGDDLSGTALYFRLLRQEGYNVSAEVFRKFMDSKGRFKEALSNDLSGLLSLHEASYLGAEGEEVLSQAMVFSKHQLEKLMLHSSPREVRDTTVALTSPKQWRTTMIGARNLIEKYGQEYDSSDLLELASLNFNIVQALHKQEIAELLNWWTELDLTTHLSFARDRPLECFLWTVGIFPDPCYSRCRIEVAKCIAILEVIDDIYDTYASLDELILFTEALRRWDIDEVKQLPEYMKICYMALYNTTNGIGYKVLKEHRQNVVPHLAKTWIDLCEAYLTEARWFNSGIVPSLENYLSNGVTSGGTYMALVHAFYLIGEQLNTETSAIIYSRPELFTSAGMILRLWNDLGTAKPEQERGDVASCIECYMKENESKSEDDARKHVRLLIHKEWMVLNRESLAGSLLPQSIIKASLNVARTSQSMYQHGDDDQFPSVSAHIQSLLQEPIHHKDFG